MAKVSDAQIEKIDGWFEQIDVDMFRLLLPVSAESGPGDLAELGVYLGKSAILIGAYHRVEVETFTVVDLFGANAPDQENQEENERSYPSLSRSQFETNYRSVHGHLPVVIQDYTKNILQHARRGNHRFVHVDAGHLYAQVQQDIEAARVLLRRDGIVVLDDFRREHTPGVAAAAWQAVASGLHPFLLTPVKMYATWGEPEPWRIRVLEAISHRQDLYVQSQQINGLEVLRVARAESRVSRYVPPAAIPVLRRVRNLVRDHHR